MFKPAIRLQNVVGLDNRVNDVLYAPPYKIYENESQSKDNGVVIFFGGDMQDFHENMISKEKAQEYAVWCLENIAKILSMHYENCHIIIVRPSSIQDGIFSKYTNFVPSLNYYGIPKFVKNYGALHHLKMLLNNIHLALRQLSDEEIEVQLEHACKVQNMEQCNLPAEAEYKNDFNGCNIELLGFSKGCVVLNQFLYEFHHLISNTDEKCSKEVVNGLIERIKTIRWLDGGHNGREETWITSEAILASYAEMGKQTYVHVTPYQVCCKKRPWIGKEEAIFTDTLLKQNVDIQRKLHFENSKGTLEIHFKLIQEVFSNNSVN